MLSKRMNFQETSKEGIVFNPKIYVADFGPLKRAFFGLFLKKLQYDFSKTGGRGGSKAVWNFSKNSSDLVA